MSNYWLKIRANQLLIWRKSAFKDLACETKEIMIFKSTIS